ncbi:hypothetical protein IAQ61_004923 [Plenodomus lingam]|uniref:F-box domain-containing protein n=1 Tax=Leptosphaeria maculans (strain JN3 / isolate v23.1.3 / race Av1-4-5-6-7-8) TaxID=985895 RepID=E4ZWW9_LEPMJ|nr:hypothetical protein LEMA_P032470.1 [Plenodomus lingam JN3]KAH9874292.1 hypothetical protein IAQ61_004923 [Plenodomus lingam]CBX96095.1 hypothetical protein LEMA_P032470.1 [Plenodomus lingam JN3]
MPSLLDLPNEILLHIIANIDLYREARILGYDPDCSTSYLVGEHLIDEFEENCRTLRNLALTCKRLSPLVAEQIIFAPLVTNWDYPETLQPRRGRPSCAHLLALIRLLVAHPERTNYVKQLRLSLRPEIELDYHFNGRKICPVRTLALIESLRIPSTSKHALRECAQEYPSITLVSILLTLVPRLERLCISMPIGFKIITEVERPCCILKRLSFHTLKYLKIENYSFIDLGHLPCCADTNILDLSISPEEIRHDFTAPAAPTTLSTLSKKMSNACLSELRHLRVDFQTRTVGIWNHGKRMYMIDLLQKFRHLKHLDFYAESSDCKNPFRSVRAFPHYQANIQNYPDESDHLPLHVEDQYWDQRLYDARTEITDYQNLVDSIIHLRPTLETLRLPGGFWTLPGGMRKPLPRFDKFTQLSKLLIPQAAILSIKLDNMRLDDVVGDFDLSPKMALPPMLRHLVVFDADAPFLHSQWLLDFFGAQLGRKQWPGFEHLEIRLGYTVEDDELERIIAGRSPSQKTFCTLARTAPFRTVVRRDDDVPSLSLE